MYNEELTTWREYYIQQQAQKVAESLGNNKELQCFIDELKRIYNIKETNEEIKEQESDEE